MNTSPKINIDIFCKVIDNFGDIGVCYRLTKELIRNNCSVRLIVDDLHAFNKICHELSVISNEQITSENIKIYKWDYFENITIEPSNVIIETFACNIPKNYLEKITSKNIWINLEYLSAETWIEDCHTAQSLVNSYAHKYFFFPGFSNKTGGLNYEKYILSLNKAECRKKIIDEFNLSTESKSLFWTLIFSYDSLKINSLISEIQKIKNNCLFFIPKDVYKKLMLLNNKNLLNNINSHIHVFEMINQELFNELLCAMDLNVVRGEDSISQANILSTPFIWDIYKQEDNVQLNKIEAFLEVYLKNVNKDVKNAIYNCFVYLNDSNQKANNDKNIFFEEFMLKYNEICCINQKWSMQLQQNQSLCNNLLNFIQSKINNI